MQNGGSRHLLFFRNGDIGQAFYCKASFHTDEIHRHLEFWSDDIFGYVIEFTVLFCTNKHNLTEPNPSFLWESSLWPGLSDLAQILCICTK